ncbi:hypothetical protein DFH29DRAFT_141256 [Suillus ampliporus]|nr:hypothetical protein DFH29DRAFT_141256 [Suillus ampliporus]
MGSLCSAGSFLVQVHLIEAGVSSFEISVVIEMRSLHVPTAFRLTPLPWTVSHTNMCRRRVGISMNMQAGFRQDLFQIAYLRVGVAPQNTIVFETVPKPSIHDALYMPSSSLDMLRHHIGE